VFEGAVEFDGWCEGHRVPLDSERYKRGFMLAPMSCFVSDWSCFTSISYGLTSGPSSFIFRTPLPCSSPCCYHMSCPVMCRCYDNVHTFHFLTFIYHMYYYSWSHDRRVFISYMTHYKSFLGLYFPHDSSRLILVRR
jgi:hypothetical protein